jgi:osmotically-inducible protein OsmY
VSQLEVCARVKYWSDTTITTSVKSRLAKEKAATLTKVNVDTRQGVVELNGTVDSSAMSSAQATSLNRLTGCGEL